MNKKSFTLVELLVITGILIILTAISVSAFHFFQREADLNNSVEEIINTLRLAQNKTLASEGPSQWGVYFDTSTEPHQFILFQGTDYGSRVISSDEIYKLPATIEIYEIILEDFNGEEPPNPPIKEVVFKRLTGETDQPGEISLRSKYSLKIKTIQIENFGRIELK